MRQSCLFVLLTCALATLPALAQTPTCNPDIDGTFRCTIPIANGNCGTIQRVFRFYEPPGDTAKPVVFFFHGSGGPGNTTYWKWKDKAETEGAWALLPHAYDIPQIASIGQWNAGDNGAPNSMTCNLTSSTPVNDAKFIRAVYNWLATLSKVDTSRIYATGVSAGGFMTYSMGCQGSDIFAAIAPAQGASPSNYGNYPVSPTSFTTPNDCHQFNAPCAGFNDNSVACLSHNGMDPAQPVCGWKDIVPPPGPPYLYPLKCRGAFAWSNRSNACLRQFFHLQSEGVSPKVPLTRKTNANGQNFDCNVTSMPTMMLFGENDLKVSMKGTNKSQGRFSTREDNLQHSLYINSCIGTPPPNLNPSTLPPPSQTVVYDCPYDPNCAGSSQAQCAALGPQCKWRNTDPGTPGICHSICDAVGRCADADGMSPNCLSLHGWQNSCENAEVGNCDWFADETWCTDCRDLIEDQYCSGDVVELRNQSGEHCLPGNLVSTQAGGGFVPCSVGQNGGVEATAYDLIWDFFMAH